MSNPLINYCKLMNAVDYDIVNIKLIDKKLRMDKDKTCVQAQVQLSVMCEKNHQSTFLISGLTDLDNMQCSVCQQIEKDNQQYQGVFDKLKKGQYLTVDELSSISHLLQIDDTLYQKHNDYTLYLNHVHGGEQCYLRIKRIYNDGRQQVSPWNMIWYGCQELGYVHSVNSLSRLAEKLTLSL